MKASHPETELSAAVNALFQRWPSLVGFSVQETQTPSRNRPAAQLEHELVLADVETDPWPAHSKELLGEIAVALLDLIDSEPAARELMRGRTFARRMH